VPKPFPVDRRIVLLTLLSAGTLARAADAVPDFNRDIRPILSDKCYRCHGPDEHDRKGGQNGLRLDTAQGAREDLGGGGFAIVPGDPAKSELLMRVKSTDEEEVMPPPKTGKALSAREIDLLQRWIAAGASYAQHWSYEKPQAVTPPVVKDRAWPRTDVDRFILARLEQDGLRPQPEADRAALARRVALDLTGLPPGTEELDAFLADRGANAYERFVDRQLAKPAYGEHWARAWLDLARYADSKGYADDQPRSIWKYRDYVIDAFNQNLPFDRFTIEQLAGDLLPNPTPAQLFATGFHRNTMNNTEGGTDDEEFRTVAVVDRVNTTLSVWMGTSIACAQCHTHKYDPLTQKEYFQLYAIFNQSEDADRNDEAPVLDFFTEEQQKQRADWEAEVAALERKLTAARTAHLTAARQWARNFPARIDWRTPVPDTFTSAGSAVMRAEPGGAIFVEAGQKTDTYTLALPVAAGETVTALRLESLPHASLPGQGAGGAKGNFVVTRVRVGIKPPEAFRRARFIRIVSPGKARLLSLAEVEVYSGGRNIAGGGVAAQVSTGEAADARRAIDGGTDGDILNGSVSQTGTADDPWWELDLGAELPLERVLIWGRRGEEGTPMGLRMSVLDQERRPVFERTTREFPRPTNTIDLTDPRELTLTRVAADFAQNGYDPATVITDAEPRAVPARKKAAPKRGWAVGGAVAKGHALLIEPQRPIVLQAGETLVVTIEQKSATANATLNHFRVGYSTDPRAVEQVRTPAAELALLQIPEVDRDAGGQDRLLDYYVRHVAPEFQTERKRLAVVTKSIDDLTAYTSLIMRELPADQRRRTHVQLRGNFRDLGEEVTRGAGRLPRPAGRDPSTAWHSRAGWSARRIPLTARVQVNRLWESIFGIGLVRTTEEFGSQGELPTHPELLDWLALDFVRGGWDQKRFLRQLVTSAAYRQSSRVTPAALAADPENRLVSRGPRFRLTAEMVRDQALAVSGLLNPRSHGPSSRPFQPNSGLTAAFGWHAGLEDEHGPGPAASGTLHRVAAEQPLPLDGRLRRAESRGLHLAS
jgi:mono/diheme cytochrome c family protein